MQQFIPLLCVRMCELKAGTIAQAHGTAYSSKMVLMHTKVHLSTLFFLQALWRNAEFITHSACFLADFNTKINLTQPCVYAFVNQFSTLSV